MKTLRQLTAAEALRQIAADLEREQDADGCVVWPYLCNRVADLEYAARISWWTRMRIIARIEKYLPEGRYVFEGDGDDEPLGFVANRIILAEWIALEFEEEDRQDAALGATRRAA